MIDPQQVIQILGGQTGVLHVELAKMEALIQVREAELKAAKTEIENLGEIIWDNAQQATTNTTLPEVEHAEP